MGLDNPLHIAVLLMIVLLVFGAKRLPEMGRSLGSGMRGFKEAISGESPAELPAAPPTVSTPHPSLRSRSSTITPAAARALPRRELIAPSDSSADGRHDETGTALRTTLRSVEHDEQLSIVEHLDELRTRMIVALAVVGVAFGLCFWQNHRLLAFVNAPLAHQTQKQVRAADGPLGATYRVQESARDIALQLRVVIGALDHSAESGPVRAC